MCWLFRCEYPNSAAPPRTTRSDTPSSNYLVEGTEAEGPGQEGSTGEEGSAGDANGGRHWRNTGWSECRGQSWCERWGQSWGECRVQSRGERWSKSRGAQKSGVGCGDASGDEDHVLEHGWLLLRLRVDWNWYQTDLDRRYLYACYFQILVQGWLVSDNPAAFRCKDTGRVTLEKCTVNFMSGQASSYIADDFYYVWEVAYMDNFIMRCWTILINFIHKEFWVYKFINNSSFLLYETNIKDANKSLALRHFGVLKDWFFWSNFIYIIYV